ncbi:PREDICTED: uncharacterized protein LOC109157475 [Ipomoea nil]|uniref:uncharacterized protein LOC109157475 n=1 Tax=Ipomoea nil TaxID=35883 RepID=UPI00090088E7|nr:PREDICTED: uncharacterized protein LOC109157475 [Ipomoea nil]
MAVSSENAAHVAADVWYPDTGATSHATPDNQMLSHSEAYTGGDVLKIGNGTGLDVSRVGHTSPVQTTESPTIAPWWAELIVVATQFAPLAVKLPMAQEPSPLAIAAPTDTHVTSGPPAGTRKAPWGRGKPQVPHTMRTRHKTRGTDEEFYVLTASADPTCYSQAVGHPQWRDAMDQEFNALLHNNTWELTPATPHMNIIGCKWVFRTKRKVDGSVERYKAQLVAKGWTLWQLDVHNTFLNGHLAETVYVKQPPGYEDLARLNHVCHLQWSLYGLKQAPRAWFKRLHDFLTPTGFLASKTDVSLFHYTFGDSRVFLLVYVDDIIMMGNDPGLVTTLLHRLSTTFKIKNLGPPSFFLGIETLTIGDSFLFSQRRLCQFMHSPTDDHWSLLKRVLRYIKGTQDYGLQLRPSASSDLHAFSDSEWAGCPVDRKSTSGYVVFLGENLVSWVSRKQHTVARSSTEAEYKGLADVAAEVTWVVSLLCELGLYSGKLATLSWCHIFSCKSSVPHSYEAC